MRIAIMDPVERIQQMLQSISPGARNAAGETYINAIKNEFVTINGSLLIPKIPVKELPYDLAEGIVRECLKYIPEYLTGHALMPDRIPPSEQHSLQFTRRLRGRLIDFIHIFKIDLRYGGGASSLVDRGNSNYYPSYYTDRLYYKSRLIPASLHSSLSDKNFSSLRLFDSFYTESDEYFHTFAIFEDTRQKETTRDIIAKLDMPGLFTVSATLYPFIVYDYFTACCNIVHPTPAEIEGAAGIFEPLFFFIFSKYRDIGEIAPHDTIAAAFPDAVVIHDGKVLLSNSARGALQHYFSRFSLFRDDDLAARGWWKLTHE